MTDKISEEKSESKQKNDVVCLGIDIGTMNIVCSRSDQDNIRTTRNMFLQLDSDEVPKQDLKDITYVEMDDNIYIIGEDSFRMANLFNKKVSRPMEQGMISPNEIDAIDVLGLIVKDVIGDVKNKETYATYSIPATAIDLDRSVTYHEKVFAKILGSLGINYKSSNEALAIIYSECQKENYTGIGISCGAGMANFCCVFRGVEVFSFSTTRSGDWIDNNTANSLNITTNRVTNIKEKYLDLSGDISKLNKKTRRTVEALQYYYQSMIDYTIKNMIKQFDEKFDLDSDEKFPIVISGGTSLCNGFVKSFKKSIGDYELPFDISEIRHAKDPLCAVSQGLLVRTLADVKGN
jgi:hypothetical protein